MNVTVIFNQSEEIQNASFVVGKLIFGITIEANATHMVLTALHWFKKFKHNSVKNKIK